MALSPTGDAIVKKGIGIGYMMLIMVLLSAIVGLIMAFPVMWLWNWILPSVTNGLITKINVFQAWGLNVLFGILFIASTAKDK